MSYPYSPDMQMPGGCYGPPDDTSYSPYEGMTTGTGSCAPPYSESCAPPYPPPPGSDDMGMNYRSVDPYSSPPSTSAYPTSTPSSFGEHSLDELYNHGQVSLL
jgi:hypothetical protein